MSSARFSKLFFQKATFKEFKNAMAFSNKISPKTTIKELFSVLFIINSRTFSVSFKLWPCGPLNF